MKILTIIISVLALVLIVFNFTQVNFEAPFKGESMIALITILAALCAIVMMLILRVSKRIEEKVKERR
ncbi:hypothetical protein QLS71_007535 [Mariniflexile litorale]|uniref:Lipopolysaccharide assembly protein A domain-containing protein n=1 Tax=Mariniflexile litorale TaxID=3045158 RepID=A0AAU7EL01_9FLAO|nr:hypothetical protein [Mariniflexile sp. KMM 9835]MDQ8211200.1 hypothetical protein [Mariniflexile sp. KMM 9835]